MKTKSILCIIFCLLQIPTGAFAADPVITIDSKGVALNGALVSEPDKSGSYVILRDKASAAIGKPRRVIENKMGEEIDIWNGISLFPAPEINLFSIEFKDDKLWGQFKGTVSVNGTEIKSDMGISVLNASLDTGTFKQTSGTPSGHSVWDIKFDHFAVRVACQNGKINGVVIAPKF